MGYKRLILKSVSINPFFGYSILSLIQGYHWFGMVTCNLNVSAYKFVHIN